MLLLAIIFAGIGLVLALNLFSTADQLARNSRALPGWLKGPGSDEPVTHRIIGAVFLVFAGFVTYAALVGR